MSTSGDETRTIRFERWPWETSPGLTSRFAAALVATFLLLTPYLANISRDYTRYCYFWRTEDTLSLGLLLLAAAAAATLAGEMVRCAGPAWLGRVVSHLFLALLGAGILANIAFATPKLPYVHWRVTTAQTGTAWIFIALLVGYSFGRPQSQILMRCRQLCLVLLPVVPITFATLLWQSTYPEALEPIRPIPQACAATRPSSNRQPAGGIYVFLFDEWSYERTFANGTVLPQYSHLADCARTSTVYRDAHAPGECTEQSLPGILLQTADPVVVHNGRLGFRSTGGAFVSARAHTSLFSRIGPLGYHTAMLGSALPYRLWLGDQVDVCRSYCAYARGEDWRSELGLHVFNAMHYSPDPWTHRTYKDIERRIIHAVTCNLIGNVRNDVRTIIREWPANTFVFAHVFLPHMPAVLNTDLSFQTPERTGWSDGNLGQYEANLRAMDALLGDFLAELRRAGKYDDALIVLTADHNWRDDPDWAAGRLRGRRDHVPLLIKAPRQDRPARADKRFETKNLGEVIESLVRRPATHDVLFTENHTR